MLNVNVLKGVYFGNPLYRYLIYFCVVIIFIVFSKIIRYFTKKIVKRIVGETKTKIDDLIFQTIDKPIVFFVIIVGFYVASFSLSMPENVNRMYTTGIRIMLTINVAWFTVNFVDSLIIEYIQPLTIKTESDLDDHLLPFVRRLVKFGILALVFIMILSDMGFDVTAIIAGLGIGGLAIALASKDMAANLFGGFTIIIDKPFKIGDRIKLGSDEGVVINIGIRKTELRGDDRRKIIIPNSKFVGNPIHNLSYINKNQSNKNDSTN